MTSSKQRKNKALIKEREEKNMSTELIILLVEIGKLAVEAIGQIVKENS